MSRQAASKGRVMSRSAEKEQLKLFWEDLSCGEIYAKGDGGRDQLETQARVRYSLEPFIYDFADFRSGAGKNILEIGVGMGADHLQWARARPQLLCGIDLTR